MKKIKYILLALIGGAVLAGCDDMLDAYPLDKMSPETFFKNESELQAFAINLYTMFPSTDLYKDGADTYIEMGLSDEQKGTRQIPASGGGWSWGSLRNVNTMLEYLPNCSDQAVAAKYEALGRFFRAYFYFEKVKRFGDVPWYDKPVGSADKDALNRPRDSREFIMGKMIEDINFAIENLPSTKSAYEITKWTAMALKSRFLLFEGTFRKYHTEFNYGDGAHDAAWYLDECQKVSEDFIDKSGYTIHTNGGTSKAYYSLFTTRNASDNMDEVVLARNYNSEYGIYHNSHSNLTASTQGRMGMTRKLVASYLMKDGSRFTDKQGWETMSFVEETKDRDPRLGQTVRIPGYVRLGSDELAAPDFNSCQTGYNPIKYYLGKDVDAATNTCDVDLIIIRAAEIYLNFAEAKAELGTLTQSDLDKSINRLRNRVGMPDLNMSAANANPDPYLTNVEWGGYQNVSGSNKGVILEIRRERTIELAQEGHRYYDIIRWKEGKILEKQYYGMYFPGVGQYDLNTDGIVDIVLYDGDSAPSTTCKVKYKVGSSDFILSDGMSGNVNPYKGITCKWDENRDYLYPIPTDDRKLTNGALTQNPGWDDGLIFEN